MKDPIASAASDSASWLKSPVSEKACQLKVMTEVVLRPYYGAKRRLKLFRTHYSIGRCAENDIVVDDPFVSDRHAELRLNAHTAGYDVLDLESRNGIYLNGVRVRNAPLPAQGSLRIGRTLITWADHENGDPELGEWTVADPAMREILRRLKQVAASSLPVILLGETGTGKEMLARLLHEWSSRASGPYVAVNGALIGGTLADSELFGHQKGAYTGAENARLGALRSAHRGTLFLDEVADIPAGSQVKLLRALESGEVRSLGSDKVEQANFRLVTATSQEIDRKVAEKEFRLDLYYRLAGYIVRVPPLRERPRDILAIARKLAGKQGLDLDQEAEGLLLSNPWPGNVRELSSAVERACIACRTERGSRILPSHLSVSGLRLRIREESRSVGRRLDEIEREAILASLVRNGWSRSVVASELGISRSTLYEKMKRYRIRDRAFVH
jgi:DNA-binding NtrC family response regulator